MGPHSEQECAKCPFHIVQTRVLPNPRLIGPFNCVTPVNVIVSQTRVAGRVRTVFTSLDISNTMEGEFSMSCTSKAHRKLYPLISNNRRVFQMYDLGTYLTTMYLIS